MAEGWTTDYSSDDYNSGDYSTYREESDGYYIERSPIEDPDFTKGDYADAARINRSLIQPAEDTPPW